MANNDKPTAGYKRLMEILSQAARHGADAIEMEYDSGGSLEVYFMVGNSGAGFALDREAGREVTDAVWEEKRKARGKKSRVTLDGTDYMVEVKTHDHFGENAYRLTVKPAKR